MAKLLAVDNDVEVITSDFYHITKMARKKIIKNLPYKVTYLHEPGYPKNVCLKRFWSHKVWAGNIKKYFETRKKPDVIYAAIPSLDGPLWVAKYCEKNNIRFVIDVQDLWPEAFQMVFRVPVISDIIFSPFRIRANGIYKRADAVCAVSDTYVNRALKVSRKCKKGTTVFLGTDLKKFDDYSKKEAIIKKNDDEIWLAYCGTLGSSYDLTCVIDALSILDNSKIRFIVMGDGPKKEEFESYAKEKKIKVEFVGRLKYDDMCSLLSSCDITINPITHKAAQSIINKHADYVASGLPIVSSQENIEFRRLVYNYRMGYNCRNNDPNDMADKINKLIDNESLRKKMGENARKCAEERFDRTFTYMKLVEQIKG